MAFEAKDGRKFGNRQKQKAYDEREPKQEAVKESPKDQSNSPAASPDEADSGDINSFVAQNGPADDVSIKHDDDAGEHTVESTHGGKKHKSKHASRDEAHMHAAQAAGLQPPQEQAPAPMQQPAQQPMGIPGLG